jgi:hypothetical protein
MTLCSDSFEGFVEIDDLEYVLSTLSNLDGVAKSEICVVNSQRFEFSYGKCNVGYPLEDIVLAHHQYTAHGFFFQAIGAGMA